MFMHARKPSTKIRTKVRPHGSDGYDYEVVLLAERLQPLNRRRGRYYKSTHRKTDDRKIKYKVSYNSTVKGTHEDVITAIRNVMPVHVHTNRYYKRQTTSLFVRGEASIVIFKTMFPDKIFKIYKLVDKPVDEAISGQANTTMTQPFHTYGTSSGSLLTGNNLGGAGGGSFSGNNYTRSTVGAVGGNFTFTPIPSQPYSVKIEGDSAVMEFTGTKPIIRTQAGEIDLELLAETVKQLSNVLCVLNVHMSTLDKYPALQSAYDNFRLLEKLVKSDEDIDPA